MYFIIGLTFVFAFAFAFANGNENQGDNNDGFLGTEVRVPVIDLAPWFDPAISSPRDRESNESSPLLSLGLTDEQLDIVRQIRRACREVGFFQITGGLTSRKTNGENKNDDDDAMIQKTWKASREFFDLSIQEKLEHATIDNTNYPYGYERSETLVRGKLLDGEFDGSGELHAVADLKETFALGPPDDNGSGMPPRRWINSPNESPGFRISLEAYYERMEDLALTLLEIFAIALDESQDFFRDKMDHHMSALRLVHYYPLESQPPQQQSQNQTHKASLESPIPMRRLVRAGAHTDYGALTILAVQDEGLEVLLRDTVGGTDGNSAMQQQQWYPVPLVPGAFVVNLGDLMQRWTNDEWISTMHRVVMPSTEAQERRYSMAYFVNINGDTRIEPLECCRGKDYKNSRVITAGEHLMAKHLASMGIDVADENKTENVSCNMEKASCNSSK